MSAISDAREKFVQIEAKAAAMHGLGKTKFTPPMCADETDVGECKHALGFHEVDSPDLDENRRYFGIVAPGPHYAGRFSPLPKVKFSATLPKRTAENIAACAAVGLSYWSEAPGGKLWGVDAHQRAHEVSVDRRRGHVSGNGRDWTPFTPARDIAQVTTLLDAPFDPELAAPAPAEPAVAERPTDPEIIEAKAALGNEHRRNRKPPRPTARTAIADVEATKRDLERLKPDYRTAAEKRAAKRRVEAINAARDAEIEAKLADEVARLRASTEAAPGTVDADLAAKVAELRAAIDPNEKPMSRKAARAVVHYGGPEALGKVPTLALIDLLTDEVMAAHHDAIRAELDSRRAVSA